MAAWLVWAAGLIVATAAGADVASQAQPAEGFIANAYQARQTPFTLPFFSMNGHILIEGAVGTRRGKFLFDTGTEFAFLLNNHYVDLDKERLFARGQAASGQELVLYRQSRALPCIEIGDGLRFEEVRDFTHSDWNFLAEAYGIPALLGTVGHGFNRNYVFVIDYDTQTITFHAYDRSGHVPAGLFDPARVVARLEFTATGVDGKLPEVAMQVGEQRITAFFDTGNLGSLELTESTQAALTQSGHLNLSQAEYLYGRREPYRRADLSGLRHGPQDLAAMRNLSFKPGPQDRIGLGYQFLKNYISVWDYQNRTLTLLRR
jgi:hypothetical protein